MNSYDNGSTSTVQNEGDEANIIIQKTSTSYTDTELYGSGTDLIEGTTECDKDCDTAL